MQLCLNVARQRMYEKAVIIQNLQENFSRERNTMAHVISTLKSELAAERRKGRGKGTREGGGKRWDKEAISASCKSDAQSRQLEGCLDQAQTNDGQQSETDLSSVQHQTSEPEFQTQQVNILVQHRPGKAVSADPLADVTQSCESAQTIVQSVEFVPERERRKRTKRALRSDSC